MLLRAFGVWVLGVVHLKHDPLAHHTQTAPTGFEVPSGHFPPQDSQVRDGDEQL